MESSESIATVFKMGSRGRGRRGIGCMIIVHRSGVGHIPNYNEIGTQIDMKIIWIEGQNLKKIHQRLHQKFNLPPL